MGRSGRRVQSFKQFVVHDDACGMKVGTDALLLGSWAGSEMTRRGGPIRQALDIGTGSGILALMVAQRFPEATVQALELEPDAAAQAESNVQRSPFSERMKVHARAVQGWSEPADLVVCNPPFFHNHPKSPERKRNLARHDDTLPLRTLFAEARRVTHEAGVFQFVFPTDRAEEVRTVAGKEGWLLSQRISLAWSDSHEPIRDLWRWVKHPGHEHSPKEEVLLMQNPEDGSWAAWLKHRLSGFLKET